MKVLFLASEATPFVKSGGLADVAGALPVALKELGLDVSLILPYYRQIRELDLKPETVVKQLPVPLGREQLPADILQVFTEDGLPVYLIDREDLYDRPNLYGNALGDYYDNLERFVYFSQAALMAAEALGVVPEVIHAHDWETGLVSALVRGPYRNRSALGSAAVVFTVHNMAYQGLFPAEKFALTGLDPTVFYQPEGLEYWGRMNLLKAGIVYAAAVTTVSPTYAQEILSPDNGFGLDGVLRRRGADVYGILNGADYRHWNPGRDRYLKATYGPGSMKGKRACKQALLRKMKLDKELTRRPLIGLTTRLDTQKGLDLLLAALDGLMALDVGLVILGTGPEAVQEALREAAGRHPGRIGVEIGFNEALAHRILAGSDIILIPSRYEPCGLTQMYALKYGTVPVVRSTGGLEDTVTAFDRQTGRGDGFKFGPYTAEALLEAVREAVEAFEDKRVWNHVRSNGFAADFSWSRAAEEYLAVYEAVLRR
jgi:starch synthase